VREGTTSYFQVDLYPYKVNVFYSTDKRDVKWVSKRSDYSTLRDILNGSADAYYDLRLWLRIDSLPGM
jgi:hypothetical protein